MTRKTSITGLAFASMLRLGVAALALATVLGMAHPAFANELPFSISVDGKKVDGSALVAENAKATDNASRRLVMFVLL